MNAPDSSLLSFIAADLYLPIEDSSMPHSAMATLISPDFAVTPNNVFNARAQEITDLKVTLHFNALSQPHEVEATVIARDPQLNFAVLRLESKFPFTPQLLEMTSEAPAKGEPWQSLIITPANSEGQFVSGTVITELHPESPENLLLLATPNPEAGVAGAPIMVNGRLVGVMVRDDSIKTKRFAAIPISTMLQSKHTDLIRSLLPVATLAKSTTEPSTELDLAAVFQRLSPSSRRAFDHANGIRKVLERDKVHMEHLIGGLFEKDDGPTQKVLADAKIDVRILNKMLSEEAERSFPASGQYPHPELTSFPPLSGHVLEAVRAARDVADAHQLTEIQSRHLIYGALSITDCGVIKRLLDLGVDKQKIRLIEETKPLSGGPWIAGYKPDAARGKDLKDLLGISREVEALCSVLAAKDVKPPLSLGLFGDWGSGKSFFMGQMEQRINALRDEAKDDPNSPYCQRIVQLWFNAWHYIDTELWASLASEIFDGLAESLTASNNKAELDYKRAQLIARQGELEAEKQKQRELAQKLEDVEKGRAEIQINPRRLATEAYNFATRQEEVKGLIKNAETEFNKQLEEELGVSSVEVKKQLLEARGLWQQMRAIWLALRDVKGSKIWIALVGVFAALFLGGVCLFLLSQHPNVQKLWLPALGAIISFVGGIAPFIPFIRRTLAILKDAIKVNRNLLETERNDLRTALENQQKQTAAKTAEVAAAREQVESLRADRKIADFIKQRNASTDYTKYQGVIARAHADFEQLSKLLEKEREESPDDSEAVLPPIDRIILYIDDLDRCPEDKVVQVLQAVHLLLAFPIFVVVVGVDSRWLLHSLKQHSSAFRDGNGQNNHDNKQADTSFTNEDKHWRSTPLNYLEKIFQIPFTLRRMEKSGFEGLIDNLVAPPTKAEPTQMKPEEPPQSQNPSQAQPEEVARTASGGEQADQTTPLSGKLDGIDQPAPSAPSAHQNTTTNPSVNASKPKAPPVPPPARINPEHLRIEDWEREVMKNLYHFIPSPRAAKRFVNIYRLLRVSVDEDKRAIFIGNKERGQHRAVLVLLAILIGYPSEATDILRKLIEEKPKQEWWQFFQQFVPGDAKDKGTGPDVDGPQAAEAERWRELSRKVEQTGSIIPSHHPCDDFVEWAGEVARYSFQSGRVLLGQQQGKALQVAEKHSPDIA